MARSIFCIDRFWIHAAPIQRAGRDLEIRWRYALRIDGFGIRMPRCTCARRYFNFRRTYENLHRSTRFQNEATHLHSLTSVAQVKCGRICCLVWKFGCLATAIRKPFERYPLQPLNNTRQPLNKTRTASDPTSWCRSFTNTPSTPQNSSFHNIRFVLRIILISNSR